jgi:flagellar biosynthesis/type III secretory pathway protein FliH
LHGVILNAIKKRDSKAALGAMSKHIHLAEKSYKSDLDRQLSEIAERIVKDVLHTTLSVDQILDAALQNYSLGIPNKS